jgi:hypothetical protein
MSIVTYLLIRHFENLKKQTNTDKTPETKPTPPQMYPTRALFKERTTIPQPHFLSYSISSSKLLSNKPILPWVAKHGRGQKHIL